jgi:type VI secretion system protein ImpM
VNAVFGFKKPSATHAFAIGKIPGHPEFLRTPDPVGASLDSWVDAGWQSAHATHGPDWTPAFGAGSLYGFVWNPGTRTEDVACGVIAPSTDSLGRVYPLLVACPVQFSLMAARWQVAPIAAEELLHQAYALVADAGDELLSREDVEARLSSIRAPGSAECDAADADYANWSACTSIEEAWAPLFAENGGMSAAGASLDALADALAPVVRKERPATSVLLRLPLAAGGSATAALWLDVVRRIGRWKQTVPSMFWAAEGDTMLLAIAPARPTTLAELWCPDPREEGVFDLSGAASGGGAAGGIGAFVVKNAGAPLTELLAVLG